MPNCPPDIEISALLEFSKLNRTSCCFEMHAKSWNAPESLICFDETRDFAEVKSDGTALRLVHICTQCTGGR